MPDFSNADALPPTVEGSTGCNDPAIVFLGSADGLAPRQLNGFFAGWRRPVSAAEHLAILRASQAVTIAVDPATNRVVGFVTALSDGILCAHITLLEVLPEYRGRGIGRALVRLLLDQLADLYAVDAVCDPELIPFYEACGMTAAVAAVRRRYESHREGPQGRPDWITWARGVGR